MNNELEQLDSKLNSLLDKFHSGRTLEELYELGVSVGRLLESKQLPDFRPTEFIVREAKGKLLAAKRKKVDEFSKMLLGLVRNAVSESINVNGSWAVVVTKNRDSYHADEGKFSSDIEKRYCVKIARVELNDYEDSLGGYTLLIAFCGDLLKAFQEASFQTYFEIWLNENAGDGRPILRNESDLDCLVMASAPIDYNSPKISLEAIENFIANISKLSCFS